MSGQSINDRLQFLRERIPVYAASPVSFGLVAGTVTQLDNAYKAADVANQAALEARTAAKKATQAQADALAAMAHVQSQVIGTIKAFADAKATVEQRNAVYTAALLPVPQPPSPQPAPEVPQSVKADPNANGTVTVKWKASTNSGAVYIVERKLAGNTTFTQIGLVSKKSFVDATVPAGTTSCEYQVRAVRGQQVSVYSQPITVRFGAGGASGFTGNASLAA